MNYGMYSDAGNAKVDAIVAAAIKLDGSNERRFSVAVGCLDELCDQNADGAEAAEGEETPYSEAMDTVVRDAVWEAIDLASQAGDGVVVNQHGAVYLDGTVIGWVKKGGCENEACLRAMQTGRMWHAVPAGFAVTLPDYHFSTRDEAIAALVAV